MLKLSLGIISGIVISSIIFLILSIYLIKTTPNGKFFITKGKLLSTKGTKVSKGKKGWSIAKQDFRKFFTTKGKQGKL